MPSCCHASCSPPVPAVMSSLAVTVSMSHEPSCCHCSCSCECVLLLSLFLFLIMCPLLLNCHCSCFPPVPANMPSCSHLSLLLFPSCSCQYVLLLSLLPFPSAPANVTLRNGVKLRCPLQPTPSHNTLRLVGAPTSGGGVVNDYVIG